MYNVIIILYKNTGLEKSYGKIDYELKMRQQKAEMSHFRFLLEDHLFSRPEFLSDCLHFP